MISNGKVKAHSGQGNFVGNFVAFLVVFFMLVGSMASLYFWDLDQVWLPGILFILLYTGSFFAAKEIIGRSDSLDMQDLHGEHGEPLDAMASRVSSSRESAAEPHVR
ncbi:hypothetical protein I2485_00885 [Nesterenkonia sp. E16_7]|uniref:hypothetical protein n=1 Tax=unclassified Nesterenkonia TaxID=2629769 RepID=UPI001A924C8A|nr:MULTISPECIES: hypothetical protein [unclassified Nesterenkonia]MBO0596532.1 hypothetical protein [Nesterenkonia sp. E16_10]MBO0597203.1 hypothetical protein [Nesterenkonia sp. E16_7]